MRGEFEDQGHMFSHMTLEERVPAQHPLRKVRESPRHDRQRLPVEGYCSEWPRTQSLAISATEAKASRSLRS